MSSLYIQATFKGIVYVKTSEWNTSNQTQLIFNIASGLFLFENIIICLDDRGYNFRLKYICNTVLENQEYLWDIDTESLA